MMGLLIGVTPPLLVMAAGALYALFFDPKSTLPRGDLRRLR